MRCPKCYAETDPDALNCPSCNLPTPRGKYVNAEKGKKDKTQTKKQTKASPKVMVERQPFKPGKGVKWLFILVLLIAAGWGAYLYVFSSSQTVKPESALSAMNELRKLPSKEEGKSIDDCMTAELKRSKDAGQLISLQGWTVKPYGKSNLLISFSFEDTGGKKSADWVVDPLNKT